MYAFQITGSTVPHSSVVCKLACTLYEKNNNNNNNNKHISVPKSIVLLLEVYCLGTTFIELVSHAIFLPPPPSLASHTHFRLLCFAGLVNKLTVLRKLVGQSDCLDLLNHALPMQGRRRLLFWISLIFFTASNRNLFSQLCYVFYMLCGNISYSSLTLFSVYEGPGCVNACCIMYVADMIA